MEKVYIYKIFERFWHWTQAILIGFLAVTGFEVHGYINLFGYKNAVIYHDKAAWAFLVLIVFCHILAFHYRCLARVYSYY